MKDACKPTRCRSEDTGENLPYIQSVSLPYFDVLAVYVPGVGLADAVHGYLLSEDMLYKMKSKCTGRVSDNSDV